MSAEDKPKKKKSSKKEVAKLPEELERIKKYVSVELKAPTHTSAPSTMDAFASLGLDNRLSLQVHPLPQPSPQPSPLLPHDLGCSRHPHTTAARTTGFQGQAKDSDCRAEGR
jgi:hypothetical protein